MKYPKLWNGPSAVGEALVRALQKTGVPYLSARTADGVYAGVMDGKAEVKQGIDQYATYIVLPADNANPSGWAEGDDVGYPDARLRVSTKGKVGVRRNTRDKAGAVDWRGSGRKRVSFNPPARSRLDVGGSKFLPDWDKVYVAGREVSTNQVLVLGAAIRKGRLTIAGFDMSKSSYTERWKLRFFHTPVTNVSASPTWVEVAVFSDVSTEHRYEYVSVGAFSRSGSKFAVFTKRYGTSPDDNEAIIHEFTLSDSDTEPFVSIERVTTQLSGWANCSWRLDEVATYPPYNPRTESFQVGKFACMFGYHDLKKLNTNLAAIEEAYQAQLSAAHNYVAQNPGTYVVEESSFSSYGDGFTGKSILVYDASGMISNYGSKTLGTLKYVHQHGQLTGRFELDRCTLTGNALLALDYKGEDLIRVYARASGTVSLSILNTARYTDSSGHFLNRPPRSWFSGYGGSPENAIQFGYRPENLAYTMYESVGDGCIEIVVGDVVVGEQKLLPSAPRTRVIEYDFVPDDTYGVRAKKTSTYNGAVQFSCRADRLLWCDARYGISAVLRCDSNVNETARTVQQTWSVRVLRGATLVHEEALGEVTDTMPYGITRMRDYRLYGAGSLQHPTRYASSPYDWPVEKTPLFMPAELAFPLSRILLNLPYGPYPDATLGVWQRIPSRLLTVSYGTHVNKQLMGVVDANNWLFSALLNDASRNRVFRTTLVVDGRKVNVLKKFEPADDSFRLLPVRVWT